MASRTLKVGKRTFDLEGHYFTFLKAKQNAHVFRQQGYLVRIVLDGIGGADLYWARKEGTDQVKVEK